MPVERRGHPVGVPNPNAGRKRGGTNPNAGRRSKTRFRLPDPIVSGVVTSVTQVTITTCHLCGAMWWESYGIVRWGADDPLAVEEVAGQPEIHLPDCSTKN